MRPICRLALVWVLALAPMAAAQTQTSPRRNVIIFIADGLRHGSVNERDTPALWAIRSHGVHFRNSYSLYPTLTTANASAIATGHQLGDTGDFANTLWLGYASFDTGNYNLAAGTPVGFVENDQILGDLDDHHDGNYLGEQTLLSVARKNGYNTAAVGKLGPAAIQDVSTIAPVNGSMPPPSAAIVIDDSTGTPGGLHFPPQLMAAVTKADIPPEAPGRSNGFGATSPYNNGNHGGFGKAGTLRANLVQQEWFADVTTKGILPLFEADKQHPFALVYWSRDPDASQHNEGDSLDSLYPGVNGPTSIAGVQNADRNLRQIMAWLDAHPEIKQNTDIFVTSDHGFATVARKEVDKTGRHSSATSAQHDYVDSSGKIDTEKGTLPSGFLAIDLATALETNLWDPDRRGAETSHFPFRQVRLTYETWEHPSSGSGLLGGPIEKADGSDAQAIVAANGGSDLIYVPDGNAERVKRIAAVVLGLDYVGAIFVDDKYGTIAGTLPLSTINFGGSTKMPRPAIVVALKNFYLNDNDLQSAIQISDTTLEEGQGMHGGFGRDSTYNNMAAIGPDFKTDFADDAPVSNADIVPTMAKVMGIALAPVGTLTGRVISEAFEGHGSAPEVPVKRQESAAAGDVKTVLQYQEFDGVRYVRTAGLEKIETKH